MKFLQFVLFGLVEHKDFVWQTDFFLLRQIDLCPSTSAEWRAVIFPLDQVTRLTINFSFEKRREEKNWSNEFRSMKQEKSLIAIYSLYTDSKQIKQIQINLELQKRKLLDCILEILLKDAMIHSRVQYDFKNFSTDHYEASELCKEISKIKLDDIFFHRKMAIFIFFLNENHCWSQKKPSKQIFKSM